MSRTPQPISELTDAELLARSLAEPEAFGIFYERHERMVFGYHMRHARDVEVSADLTAETFAAALGARGRFRAGPEPASAWLIGIAHNKLLTSYRRGQVDTRARKKLGIAPIALTDASLERAEAIIDDQLFPMQQLLARIVR